MKRFFLLAVTFVVVISGIYLLSVHRRPGRNPLELVSRDAVLVLEWTDSAGAVKDFIDSPLGRSLTGINWSRVFKQLDLTDRAQSHLEQRAAQLQRLLHHPLFKELFSRKMVLALLPPDHPDTARETDLARRLLLILEPRHRGTSLAASLPLPPGSGWKKENMVYQGVPVTGYIPQNGIPVYGALVDNHLALSPGLESVHQVIDLSQRHFVQDRTGIVLNQQYMELKKRARGREDFFLYGDLTRLKPLVRLFWKSNHPPGGDYPGSDRMAFFHLHHRRTEQFTAIVQFEADKLAPFQRTIYTRPPVRNRSLDKMPSDLLVYFWSNWLDLGEWWRETLARGTDEERAAAGRISAWIQERTGMKIDRFLGLFGREFGFNIAEIRTSGFIPVPRICFCIEVTDPDQVQQLIEQAIAGMPLRRDRVAGVPVVSIMAANGLMQPSYAMLDRFLVIADSRQQIEDVLRTSSRRLIRDREFEAVDMGMLRPANLVVFARTSQLIEGLRELASWAGTIIAIRDPQAGEKSKVLVDQVILPLLDGMKMYRAKGVRSYTALGEVVLESVVLVADPAAAKSK